MRSLVLVILCGVAALSFFCKPGDALSSEAPNITEEAETSYPPNKSFTNDTWNENTTVTLSVIFDQLPESTDEDLYKDTNLENEDVYRDTNLEYEDLYRDTNLENEDLYKDTNLEYEDLYQDKEVIYPLDEAEDRRHGCRPKRSCKRESGVCKKKCHRKKEVKSKKGMCKGRRCSCCVKKPKTCKQKGECVGKGTCRKTCLQNEIHAGYLSCVGKKCSCCLVNQGPCGPESQHGVCRDAGGTCKPKCDGERVVAGLCPGPHCSCCIPNIPCANTNTCSISGGKCKPVCLDTEVRLPGNCGQGRCFCCGPPPTECTQSPICPGTCSQTCKGVISLEDHCLGSSCLCCLDCSPKTECTDANGECKSLCGCGEKELPGGCNGGGCKCCVADVLECKDEHTLSCTNCIYTPLCTAEHTPQKTCASQKGCSCC